MRETLYVITPIQGTYLNIIIYLFTDIEFSIIHHSACHTLSQCIFTGIIIIIITC